MRLRDSLLRPCYDFLLFFTTQTRPVHRETDSGDEKFITPINKIHNPILGYGGNRKYVVTNEFDYTFDVAVGQGYWDN